MSIHMKLIQEGLVDLKQLEYKVIMIGNTNIKSSQAYLN